MCATALGSIRSPDDPRWFGPPFVPSVTLGVGRSVGASESSDGLTAAPADGDWLFPYGVAVGVGSSEIVCRRFIPPSAACPTPFASDTVGVGSSSITFGSWSEKPRPRASLALGVGRPGEDEDPLTLVGSTDIGRPDDLPFRIEPEAGQVCEYGTECPQKRFITCVSHTPRAGFHVTVSRG